MMTLILFALLCVSRVAAHLVSFSNVHPRTDVKGSIINAHDGTTRQYGGPGSPFYYHAIGYPACNETGNINGCNDCIFAGGNTIDIWMNSDLKSGSWVKTATVYPGSAGLPNCTYFRSQVVFSPLTKRYVLWVNAVECVESSCPGGVCGQYSVATASAPGGPFVFINMATPPPPVTDSLGDHALFVDERDGGGYIVVTHLVAGAGPRDMIVFALTPDFLHFSPDPTETSGVLPGQKLVEAPSFFKRESTYYILLGGCTCMGLYGGGVAALTSTRGPLGPWTNVSSTLDPGCPMHEQDTCFEMGPGAICNPATQAQQNFVIQVPLADGTTAMIWTGDRWQQSPDGMFDKQPQTWLPLNFDGDAILPLKYVDSFTLDVAA